MSPRSEEFIEQARERLADAQKILGLVHPAVAANTAYYAMLTAGCDAEPGAMTRAQTSRLYSSLCEHGLLQPGG